MPAHKGVKHHLAKMTPELVRELRARHQGGASCNSLMHWLIEEHDLEMAYSTIYEAVVRRSTWTRV